MQRRTHEKYTPGSYESSLLMKQFAFFPIADLLSWMEEKVGKTEVIEISHWI